MTAPAGVRATPPIIAPAMTNERVAVLPSRLTGRDYRIQVFIPPGEPPATGFPVFYLTDGAMMFRQAADQMWARRLTDLRPALIVGIAHPSDDIFDFIRLRTWDLTPTRPVGPFRTMFAEWGKFGGYGEDDTGGAELFHRFLVEELRPWLSALAPIDLSDQSLFGHSLGGLFGLHVLFTRPETFRTYAISSPTLVWNDGEILQHAAALETAVSSGAAAPRILLARGGVERIDGFADLARRLQALQGVSPLEVEKAVFRGEHHLSVVPAAISRAMGFALSHLDPLPEAED